MTRPVSPPIGLALPIAAVLTGLASFNLMDAAMKSLGISLGAYNAILWRVLLALIIVSMIYLVRRPKMPSRSTLIVHLLRGIITVFMAFLFFWALVRVPIAEAIALSFIAPIIALYLAAVMLGETIHRNAIFASILGLAGVAIIAFGKIRGGYSSEELLGFGAILASALLYALNLVIQRTQALAADPVEISFFQNLIVGLCYLVVAPFFAEIPDTRYAPMFLAAAVLSIISAMLLAWAYRRAEAQVLINFEYSAFFWAALFGWLFFREPLTVPVVMGTLCIIAGCLLATQRGQPVSLEKRTIA